MSCFIYGPTTPISSRGLDTVAQPPDVHSRPPGQGYAPDFPLFDPGPAAALPRPRCRSWGVSPTKPRRFRFPAKGSVGGGGDPALATRRGRASRTDARAGSPAKAQARCSAGETYCDTGRPPRHEPVACRSCRRADDRSARGLSHVAGGAGAFRPSPAKETQPVRGRRRALLRANQPTTTPPVPLRGAGAVRPSSRPWSQPGSNRRHSLYQRRYRKLVAHSDANRQLVA
jgi:hypothetical protein